MAVRLRLGFFYTKMKHKTRIFLFLVASISLSAYFLRDKPATNASSEANYSFPIASNSQGLGQQSRPTVAISFDGLTEKLATPLEKSDNLQAIYEQYKNSQDPIERHIAYRAWSACFPQLIAAKGEAISIEKLSSGFAQNDPQTPLRINALRSLMGKCKNFSALSREQLVQGTTLEKEAANGNQSSSPGEMANQQRIAGNTEQALQVVRSILNSKDAFAIATLPDFIQPYLNSKIEEQTLPASTRSDLKALALSLAACELGMACAADTLSATQLCATSGECSGSLNERYLNRMQTPSDRALLQAETNRVLEAIRSKNFALILM